MTEFTVLALLTFTLGGVFVEFAEDLFLWVIFPFTSALLLGCCRRLSIGLSLVFCLGLSSGCVSLLFLGSFSKGS